MASFGKTSRERLDTCHVDLQMVMNSAIVDTPVDFAIICGFRDQADQDKAYHQGYSKVKWPNGKHNSCPSRAVDVAPVVGGAVVWDDLTLFRRLAEHIKKCALELNVSIEWGGDWVSFVDNPHFELKGVKYGT